MVDARKSEHASASCSLTAEPPQQQIIRKEPQRRLHAPPNSLTVQVQAALRQRLRGYHIVMAMPA